MGNLKAFCQVAEANLKGYPLRFHFYDILKRALENRSVVAGARNRRWVMTKGQHEDFGDYSGIVQNPECGGGYRSNVYENS